MSPGPRIQRTNAPEAPPADPRRRPDAPDSHVTDGDLKEREPSSRASQAAVVIPARLGSTRFPRKVLARDTGKYLIQHVWEGVRGAKGVARIIIATDSEEVLEAARSFGAEACLTSAAHRSGSERVAEVARGLPEEVRVIVNVQGDEPLVEPEDVGRIVDLFEEAGEGVVMTTLAVERRDAEGFRDPNNVKVVIDSRGRALYFSRAPIPSGWEGVAGGSWLHHVGIYGYRRDFLLRFAGLPPSGLAEAERLEQLRALENGFEIQVGITRKRYRGIDTEEEYREFVREEMASRERGAAKAPSGSKGRVDRRRAGGVE